MALTIKNRVPTKPGRIKLTDENGTSAYYTLERADEPTEEGTAINKTLLDNMCKAENTLVSSDVQTLLGADNVDDGLKKLAPMNCYWWKRRPVNYAWDVTQTSEQIYMSFNYNQYPVGSSYTLNEDKTFSLAGTQTTVNMTQLAGWCYLYDEYTVHQFVSLVRKVDNDRVYQTNVIKSEQVPSYGDYEYVFSANKNKYPTTEGTELDGYVYDKFYGQPLSKAVLIDNSTEADNLALIIQNLYDITLLQLGIAEE